MRDIDKALELYRLMAERCEKGGVSLRQAAVYREMIEFMKDCDTAMEASVKIKKSKYYLAPSVALVQDRLIALEKASRENEMPEVAEIYRKKLEEIDSDTGAIYDSAYTVTANNKKARYIRTMEAFGRVYEAYLRLFCCISNDTVEQESALRDLRSACGEFSLPSADFSVLAANPRFRSLLPASDAAYALFADQVPLLLRGAPDFSAEQKAVQEDAKREWENLRQNKQCVIAAGKKNLGKTKSSRVTAVAPSSSDGAYRYLNEEVR